jgi:periplasmic divalent cation tolerance protein
MEEILLLCTVDTMDNGKALSQKLVEERLAACVNMVPSVSSVFSWEGEVHNETEQLLIIKSREDLFEKLEKVIVDNHPYKIPEIIALPVVKGYSPYMKWFNKSLES